MERKNITLQQMRELVAGEKWVKTPYRYTQLSAGLSLIQQQALLMVSRYLQTYIRDFYNMKLDRSKKRPKALFSEHVINNGLPPMKIYLADIGILPSNYGSAREAIEQINLMVEHPEFDDEGHPTGKTLLTNVFSQFGFEETGEYYTFGQQGDDGNRQAVRMKQPWIDVKINPDVAEWAFDMSQGYVNHLELIASYSTKRPTPRLYLMLMNRTKKGEHEVTIPLQDLKEYLGIMPRKDERTGETVVPYPKFANFRQKVLDAVKADLDRMAALQPPKTDITFTYDLLYPGTRKKGDPEAIIFHVTRTVLGDAYNVIVNHKPSELMAKPVQQEIDFGDADQTAPHSLTKEQTETASRACYQALRAEMGLTGCDVWFLSYDAPTHTVTYSYDRQRPELYDKLIGSSRFLSIIHNHFGNEISVKLRASGV